MSPHCSLDQAAEATRGWITMQSSGLLRMQRVLGGDLGVGEGGFHRTVLRTSWKPLPINQFQEADGRGQAHHMLLSDTHESLVAFSQN